ncbi:MAG: sigma-70 family RNA polymerase sigma factor, partial [Leptolyngbyaceae cyanobacterium MO_188.B28]|nr:sigma-70 family RNA polymerase sigma factor [Leptolyngbyaceae cyanobacterium MO_188.B28]
MDSSQTDTELFQALQKGQTSALGILYERYSELVYTIALKMLGDPQDAEDLTQEIFLRLWRRSEYRPSRGSLVRFLATLTRMRAVAKLRSRRGRRQLLRSWGRPTNTAFSAPHQVGSVSASDDRSQQIQHAWIQLPDHQRQILTMAYYQGLSQLEIAKQLDIPLKTVKYQARQGLLRLRTRLQNLINDRGDDYRRILVAKARTDAFHSAGSLAAVLLAQKPFTVVFGITASIVSLLALMFGGFYIVRVNPFATGVQPSVSSLSNRDVTAAPDMMAPAQTLTAHADVVWSLALSADGQTLVSGGADKTIKIWNLETNQVLHTLSR